ncbi:tyrosine-protein phosphatase [Streptomyces sp. NPDC001634]|uniref:tyrosine-protein phosphatase n=1 Tax=Streptomyces sp. NPDC001634 TaxID=3154390 RepID=UPI00332D11AA
MGGCTTADGRRARPGRLFRADSLGKPAEGTDDWDRFLSLGIRTVVDLRYPWEIAGRGRIPEHASFTYHLLAAWRARNAGRTPTRPSWGHAPAEVMHSLTGVKRLDHPYGA